ncbi:glycosyltransferase family 4 protein [Rhodocytophaga aerolata]|uniref:Glycosyltransferase family 4 protein n=1 Tax=Rhodocytophaga aerolata TaxID=455078 RepID=A0ABT8R9T3_9BACT|nr:glycosyltransferase family 4 protein [Rhodocytophaga aerolata]MDO1448837.1 glycosyltransferase family 4 protein [Rhodocytophaga aerolata]
MRIAFVSTMSGTPWGGSEELWVKTALEALNQGHTILASVIDWNGIHKKLQVLQNNGALIHLRPRFREYPSNLLSRIKNKIDRTIFNSNPYFEEIKDIIDFEPDVVIFNQTGTYGVLWANSLTYLLDNFSIKYYLICHGSSEHDVLPYDLIKKARKIFENASLIIFASKRNHLNAERELACKIENYKIIRETLSIDDLSVVDWPSEDRVSFASVGRLSIGDKGQDILLSIFNQPHWRTRNWRLNLYGEGDDERYLRDLSKFYNISDRVNFCGYRNIREIWTINHCLLMPSIIEGTPIALMEAMIIGRPSVVSDVGGNAEVITEGLTGFVAGTYHVNCFSKAIERAWASKEEWRNIGLEAHYWSLNNLDLYSHKTFLQYILN